MDNNSRVKREVGTFSVTGGSFVSFLCISCSVDLMRETVEEISPEGVSARIRYWFLFHYGKYALPWLALSLAFFLLFYLAFLILWAVNIVYRDVQHAEYAGLVYIVLGLVLSVNIVVGMWLYSPVLKLDMTLTKAYTVPTLVATLVLGVIFMVWFFVLYWSVYGWVISSVDVEQVVEDTRFLPSDMPTNAEIARRNEKLSENLNERELWRVISSLGLVSSCIVLVVTVLSAYLLTEKRTEIFYVYDRTAYKAESPFRIRMGLLF